MANQKRRLQSVCQHCGKVFEHVASAQGKFCSHSCLGKSKTGERHPKWMPEGSLTVDGYVRVTVPGKGRFLKHRMVMEEHLGRPLREDEQIHHRNGIKTDNRIENLEIVSVSEHIRRYHPKPKSGRWAQKHECCVECGTTERKHVGHGLCSRCDGRRRYAMRSSSNDSIRL